jgi:hypothetical protein
MLHTDSSRYYTTGKIVSVNFEKDQYDVEFDLDISNNISADN